MGRLVRGQARGFTGRQGPRQASGSGSGSGRCWAALALFSKPCQPIAGKRIRAHLQLNRASNIPHTTHCTRSSPPIPAAHVVNNALCTAARALPISIRSLAGLRWPAPSPPPPSLPSQPQQARLRPSLPRACHLHPSSLPSPCTTTSPYRVAPSLLTTRSEDASAATATCQPNLTSRGVYLVWHTLPYPTLLSTPLTPTPTPTLIPGAYP